MANKRGTLSINSDNIFPIIKKWLYSDHDIFFRELISNGCDAITKLKKLEVMGEYTFPENHKNKIQVIVNPEEKTLKFIDTGLGMTAEEVEEYITRLPFQVQPSSWRNTKTRQTKTRLSDTLVWDSILHLWWQMKCRLIRFLIRKALCRYTGPATAAPNTKSVREIRQKWVLKLPCF